MEEEGKGKSLLSRAAAAAENFYSGRGQQRFCASGWEGLYDVYLEAFFARIKVDDFIRMLMMILRERERADVIMTVMTAEMVGGNKSMGGEDDRYGCFRNCSLNFFAGAAVVGRHWEDRFSAEY